MKQHTQDSIKKDFVGNNISKRTAKIRLASIFPGDDDSTKSKRSRILSDIIRDKNAVNSKKAVNKKAERKAKAA